MAALADSPVVAFVATVQPHAARSFYRDALGLPLRSEDDYALVFGLAGTSLRVAKVKSFTPQPFTVLGWNVVDLAATLHELVERGVEPMRVDGIPQDARGVWTTPNGAQVVWFKDPDGNTLSITELAKPEGA